VYVKDHPRNRALRDRTRSNSIHLRPHRAPHPAHPGRRSRQHRFQFEHRHTDPEVGTPPARGLIQVPRRLQQPAHSQDPRCRSRRRLGWQPRRSRRLRRYEAWHPRQDFHPQRGLPAKIQQIQSYGADLVVGGALYADALVASEAWVKTSGALPIHAFDQVETLLGQGTVGLELEQQAPNLDTLLVSVGGGGLIAGIASWYRGKIKIVGVEPELAPTLTRALEAGCPVDAEAGGIAADSLAPRRVGELVFPIAQQFVSGTVLVTDEAIREAQRSLWKTLRIVAEPGGAAAFAALASSRYIPQPNECIGVVICGGNTTAVDFGT